MTIRALLTLALLVPASAALAGPREAQAAPETHPAVEAARAERTRLRAELERLQLEREVSKAQAVAASARAPRAPVAVAVPTLRVQRAELRFAVTCPPGHMGQDARMAQDAGSLCDVRLRRPGIAVAASPDGSFEVPAALD